MGLLDEIKRSMRISNNKLDDTIQSDIMTCCDDLEMRGITSDTELYLVRKACELYCKWQFNFAELGERYEKHYRSLTDSMALSEKYRKKETASEE